MPRLNVPSDRLRRSGVLFGSLLLVLPPALLLIFARASLAELKGPQPQDQYIAFSVSTLLRREHLSKHPLDDEISRRWLAMYLKRLDPMKMYFMQSDIDEFNKFRDKLDDMVRQKDLSFGYTAFNRFLARVDERVKLVNELLKQPQDFTVEEEMVTEPDDTTYAKTDAEMRDNWRKRVKYDLLALKYDKLKLEGSAALEKVAKRYHSFARRMHQTDNDELLEMYLTALTSAYDPHTSYMSPNSLDNFEIQMRLNLEGIGAALEANDDEIVVNKIIPGGAADKEGNLKKHDKIVGVGEGADGPIVKVTEMKLNDVVKLIRGRPGTLVRLEVIPDGKTEHKVYTITRAMIELSDSAARSEIVEDGKKPDGSAYRLGVINLPSFYMDMSRARDGFDDDYRSTTRDVAKLLKAFNDKKVDVVVLDLRGNGGGSLTEAIKLTGLFIDHGPIVQVKDTDGRVQHYDDDDDGMAWSGPLVVLTSKFSASASEIFAGAIQDYRRGLIVGDNSTHGKGTVQTLIDVGRQLFPLPNAPKLGALKITIQQFYRPDGDSTQNRGVLADIELPSISSQLDVGESSLDYALKFDRVDSASYKSCNLVDQRTIEKLKELSVDRRKKSKDFDRVLRNITRYNEQKKRKHLSLSEARFMADRAEMDAEKEEEKQLEELNDPDNPVVRRDYYFDEVMAIAEDYLRLRTPPTSATVGRRLTAVPVPSAEN